jgi:hypothetical protein
MHRNHATYKPSSRLLKPPFPGKGNSLGIVNTNFLWDHKRKQLILTMESSQLIDNDLNVFIKGHSLLLEAPLQFSYNRPLRMHHIGQKFTQDYGDGLSLIGFSEIELKSTYTYRLISYQVFDSNMIEVILGYTVWGNKKNYNEV